MKYKFLTKEPDNLKHHLLICREMHDEMRAGYTNSWYCICKIILRHEELRYDDPRSNFGKGTSLISRKRFKGLEGR